MTRYRTVINSGGCQGTVDMPVWVVRAYAGMPNAGPTGKSHRMRFPRGSPRFMWA